MGGCGGVEAWTDTQSLAIHLGFTVFDNLFTLNGTVYAVSDTPKSFPEVRYMISSGYPVFNGPEEVAKREPGPQHMSIISTKDAYKLFGTGASRVEGVTVSPMRC